MVCVGDVDPAARFLVDATKQCLDEAVELVGPGAVTPGGFPVRDRWTCPHGMAWSTSPFWFMIGILSMYKCIFMYFPQWLHAFSFTINWAGRTEVESDWPFLPWLCAEEGLARYSLWWWVWEMAGFWAVGTTFVLFLWSKSLPRRLEKPWFCIRSGQFTLIITYIADLFLIGVNLRGGWDVQLPCDILRSSGCESVLWPFHRKWAPHASECQPCAQQSCARTPSGDDFYYWTNLCRSFGGRNHHVLGIFWLVTGCYRMLPVTLQQTCGLLENALYWLSHLVLGISRLATFDYRSAPSTNLPDLLVLLQRSVSIHTLQKI